MSEPPLPCDWRDCPTPAANAITFTGVAGHVHDCERHTAVLREWTDIYEVIPLPCPWADFHNISWTDTPRELA